MGRQANSKGMRPDGRRARSSSVFVMAFWAIFDHPDYLSLSKTSRAFLWEVARQYNGYNNGNISIAVGIMGPRGWDKKTIQRCRDELVAKNWLSITRLPRAKREPILYRLTWIDLDRWDGKPTLDPDAYRVARRSLR